MKKIFLTGATGLLGNNLIRELIGRGYSIKALIQPGISTASLDGLGIEMIECDLLDKPGVIKAVKGSHMVIHVAAYTAVWPSREKLHWDVNTTGTDNMVEAALKAGVERFIYVGSASSMGFGTKDLPGQEDTPPHVEYGLDYIDSKKRAQVNVLKAVKERGLPAIVVNPTFMIGAYDYGPSSGAMIIAAANGKIPGFSKGGKNWVSVRDVAVGIANSLEKGEIGECYLLGNENLSYKEAITIISEVVGKKPPAITWPNAVIKTIGTFGGLLAKITGKKPTVSYTMARIACDGHYFSARKAVKELDLPQTPFRKSVEEAVNWFKNNGYLSN